MSRSVENQQEVQFNIGSVPTSKQVIQSFYRQQLDTIMQQKNKQKISQRREKQKQKEEYNQRIRQMNELEELKTLSYKNYYQMLMENQNRNHTQFIPNTRDQLKDGHITRNLQLDKDRNIEQEIRLRQREMKDSYKKQLTEQMQQKRNVRSLQKRQDKQIDNDNGKVHPKLEQWQQIKKVSDQANYRQSLDKEVKQKQRSKSIKHNLNKINEFNIDESDQHNPLNNPLPYNIQNPYILRQMMRSSLGRNQSYLSSIANNNL